MLNHLTATSQPVQERRWRRLPDPPCPTCGSEEIHGAVRTEYVVYFRCRACASVWAVPKPGIVQLG
jgi:formate dehydrogenase maturation protein FdhE